MLSGNGPHGTPRPLRVALLCSRRAPGLEALLSTGTRGSTFELTVVVTSDPDCTERRCLTEADVPCEVHDIRACGAGVRDIEARRRYDRATVDLLARSRPDLVILCGYLHIVTGPLLEAYPDRIVNVHDSALPHYPGLHAVRDAIFAGERATRSTLHVVTDVVDAGPPLLRSWAFPSGVRLTFSRPTRMRTANG
jgi:phosphoribosylglycinamide formyltransferase 1